MSYTVKKISSKRWDILKDQSLLIPNFTVLTLANKTASVLTSEVAGAVAPVPVPSVPVPSPPPARSIADLILGPMLSREASLVLTDPPLVARYFADYDTNDDAQFKWCAENPTQLGDGLWASINYYDRAENNYAHWLMSGRSNRVYLDRANLVAEDYLHRYIEPNYDSSAYWAMIKGLALNYALNGSEASRLAVGQIADVFTSQVDFAWYMNNLKKNTLDDRSAARMLEAATCAAIIKAPSNGTKSGYPGGNDWVANGRAIINAILANQDADGVWHHLDAGNGKFVPEQPFMIGMLVEALADWYTAVEKDPRVVPSIKRALDWCWDKLWFPAQKAFGYLEFGYVDSGGQNWGTDPIAGAPDLNMLIVEGFGFVYAMTGDPLYKERGDLVWQGGVEGAYVQGMKQFNQQYSTSYNYLAYTHPGITTVTGDRTRDWLA